MMVLFGKTSEIAEYLDLSPSRTRKYLKELVDGGIIVAVGTSNKARTYRLKNNKQISTN